MSFLVWIILGLVAGYIANQIVDREGKGLWLNMALGIVGAIVGGVIFSVLGGVGITGINIYSLIVAVVGSLLCCGSTMPSAGGERCEALGADSLYETRSRRWHFSTSYCALRFLKREGLESADARSPRIAGFGGVVGGGGAAAPTKPGGAPSPGDEGGGLLEGLGGLLDRFRQSGQGKTINSWIGTGPNEPVSPGQLGNALGPNIIKGRSPSGLACRRRNCSGS